MLPRARNVGRPGARKLLYMYGHVTLQLTKSLFKSDFLCRSGTSPGGRLTVLNLNLNKRQYVRPQWFNVIIIGFDYAVHDWNDLPDNAVDPGTGTCCMRWHWHLSTRSGVRYDQLKIRPDTTSLCHGMPTGGLGVESEGTRPSAHRLYVLQI